MFFLNLKEFLCWNIILFCLFLACLITSFNCLHAASIPIKLEFAITDEEREKGLMGRTHLKENAGMLFIFPASKILSFWMFQTDISLSIAYLDEEANVMEIHEMEAFPQIQDRDFFLSRVVTSHRPARYALEMNKGWFQKKGIKLGDKLVWNINTPHASIEIK